jgi:hypothetical protein
MNSKDFAIGVLTVTATVLLTTVLLLTVLTPKPVQAYAQLDEGAGYTMLTVLVSDTTELLNVIDHAAGLMNLYRYDINVNKLLPLQQIPLSSVQAATAAPGGGQAR